MGLACLLAVTVHGLIFGRAYYRKNIASEIWGAYFREGLFSGGGAYYRNFMVS